MLLKIINHCSGFLHMTPESRRKSMPIRAVNRARLQRSSAGPHWPLKQLGMERAGARVERNFNQRQSQALAFFQGYQKAKRKLLKQNTVKKLLNGGWPKAGLEHVQK